MRLVNIEGMTNFEVKTTDGKEYVLLPFKHLYDIPTVPAIPLDKVKKAREEIEKLRGCSCSCSDGIIDDVEDILDKLIEIEDS